MTTLNEFRAEINAKKGLHNPNRFELIVTRDWEAGKAMQFFCESTSLPGSQISTFESPLNGTEHQIKVPNGLINEDVTCTFMLTNDFAIKKFFDGWRDAIITDEYLLNYAADYESDIMIKALDQKNHDVYSVKLENAYPITTNTIQLSNATQNEITKFEVTFTYRRAIPDAAAGEAAANLAAVKNAAGNVFKRFRDGLSWTR